MQPLQTNQFKKRQSRCTYCGSTNRGKGCPYGPHKVHVHLDDPLKCSYCGSTSYGRGCKINPINDLHIRGAFYNSMIKETAQNFWDSELLIHDLKKPYTEFACYKEGVIDEKGNNLKEPILESEVNSFTPYVKTILKIKRFLGSKVDLLEASALLENSTFPTETVERYQKILEHKQKIESCTNELYKVLDEAFADGLTAEEVKKLIKA